MQHILDRGRGSIASASGSAGGFGSGGGGAIASGVGVGMGVGMGMAAEPVTNSKASQNTQNNRKHCVGVGVVVRQHFDVFSCTKHC